MSAQRSTSAFSADRRSAYPGLPGVPWWAAVIIALFATVIGIFFDAGDHELGAAFATLYVFGCVLAVLAVRQSGIFTAVIQPPMILFAAVPGAYFLFHGAKFADLKDTLISCVYPLIERFPLMLFTSAGVLLIGMARWYFATAVRPTVSTAPGKDTDTDGGANGTIISRFTAFGATFASRLRRNPTAPADRADERQKRQHSRRPTTGQKRPRSGERSAATRTRHARPPVDDIIEPPPERRPRRPRDQGPRKPPTPRREPPASREGREPREGYGRPSSRGRRFEPYEPEPYEPYPPRPARDRYQPYEPPPRRRPESGGPYSSRFSRDLNSGSSTHHPVSRVRYRGESVRENFDDSLRDTWT